MKKGLGKILTITGLLLIAAALVFVIFNVAQENRSEKISQEVMQELHTLLPEETEQTFEGRVEAAAKKAEQEKKDNPGQPEEPVELETPEYLLSPEIEMPTVEIQDYDFIGYIAIPRLSLELPVIDEASTDALQVSPCRYAGSVYTDNLVIAAHNYRAHFGSLGMVQVGDPITFTDMDGNRFPYVVEQTDLLGEYDVEAMLESDFDLTLFTCTLDRKQRITVRCSRVE